MVAVEVSVLQATASHHISHSSEGFLYSFWVHLVGSLSTSGPGGSRIESLEGQAWTGSDVSLGLVPYLAEPYFAYL